MRISELRTRLRALGANADHQRRFLRLWSQGRPQASGRRPLAEFLPARLLAALPALEAELAALVRLESRHVAADGGARLLLRLGDGQTAEGVLLPRGGLCVSSQIGCAVGCVFCMTGRDGLIRHLGSAEIVAQVVLGRTLQPLRKVVFMGMGEPAHNLDEVMEAITLLGTVGGFAHKQLVFSTVGDPRVFARLPEGPVRPALALSLHSTREELRSRLLPRAPRMSPDELVVAADQYAERTGYPIQYQWTLLAGINDGDEEVQGIVRLLRGKYAVMNLIPYNTVADLPYQRPAQERALEIARTLHGQGIRTTLRESAAQEVEGGCGQLRARHLTGSPSCMTEQPPQRFTIPARRGLAVRVRRGQSLRVINTHGTQVVDTWAFNQDDLGEFLSMEHSRAHLLTVFPSTGSVLCSNRRRPVFTFLEDTSGGRHDTLIAACDRYRYEQLGWIGHHDNCTDNLSSGLAQLGLQAPETPAPLNLFMHVPITPTGELAFEPPLARAGSHVTLRAELDLVVAFSACPQDLIPVNGVDCRPVDAHFELLP